MLFILSCCLGNINMVLTLFPNTVWLQKFARLFWEMGTNPANLLFLELLQHKQNCAEVSSQAPLSHCERGSLQKEHKSNEKALLTEALASSGSVF